MKKETLTHEGLLKLGSDIWNSWRSSNDTISIDLHGAQLSGLDLSGANLVGVNLSEANLAATTLSEADLREVNLNNANLEGAVLREVDLWNATLKKANLRATDFSESKLFGARMEAVDLFRANLTGVDLSLADLRGASMAHSNLSATYFSEADLFGVDLTRAELFKTVFVSVDLSTVSGLATCKHVTISSLDFKTLAISKDLPVEFLRGVGLSEDRIRSYLYGETITIEFTASKWGQLTPIEAALVAKLGDEYVAEKTEDRIVVKLKHASQFESAMDAVIPVLAAIHKTVPGAVKSIEAIEKGEEPVFVEDLRDKLNTIIQRLETAPQQNATAELMPHEEAIVAVVHGGSRKFAALALEKWFKSGDKIHEKVIDPVSWKIYENYLQIIGRLKNTTALRPAESIKELPPPQ